MQTNLTQGGGPLRDGRRRQELRPGLAADGVQLGKDLGGVCDCTPGRHGCIGLWGPRDQVSDQKHNLWYNGCLLIYSLSRKGSTCQPWQLWTKGLRRNIYEFISRTFITI